MPCNGPPEPMHTGSPAENQRTLACELSGGVRQHQFLQNCRRAASGVGQGSGLPASRAPTSIVEEVQEGAGLVALPLLGRQPVRRHEALGLPEEGDVDEFQHHDRLPVLALALRVERKVKRVEIADGRLGVCHQPLPHAHERSHAPSQQAVQCIQNCSAGCESLQHGRVPSACLGLYSMDHGPFSAGSLSLHAPV